MQNKNQNIDRVMDSFFVATNLDGDMWMAYKVQRADGWVGWTSGMDCYGPSPNGPWFDRFNDAQDDAWDSAQPGWNRD